MRRRNFLTVMAAAAPIAAASRIDLNGVKIRKAGKVEIVFDSPGLNPKPNGLQATDQGLWIIDQGAGNKAYLVDYEHGKTIREFETETTASSGITFDGEALWIGSTYSREIVKTDSATGKALERHFTPGAGVIYKVAGDAPQRSSPLAGKRQAAAKTPGPNPASNRPSSGRAAPQVGGFQMGEVLGGAAPGTGAHGQEWRDGKLWFAVPPSRSVYCIDPGTWVVQTMFPTAGNRPHGIGWEGKYLWVTDSNLNAFHKHDPQTGEIVEKIVLADSDPLPHGMTIRNNWMWYCDDVGVICRMKI
jgi:sugar lactone lactonase YvrE